MQQKRQYRISPNMKHNINQEMGTQQTKEFRSMLIIQRSKINYGPERVINNHMSISTQELEYNLHNTKTNRLKLGEQIKNKITYTINHMMRIQP